MNHFDTNDNREWYRNTYLKSDHWMDLRKTKLVKNPICERCEQNRATDVHHLRYKNIFDVNLSDLKSVCRPCHKIEHEIAPPPKIEKMGNKLSRKERREIKKHNKSIKKEKVKSKQQNKVDTVLNSKRGSKKYKILYKKWLSTLINKKKS